ncbi:MAG: helix-turn-helix transcriptional regulator [Saprospiraceae bacterium]
MLKLPALLIILLTPLSLIGQYTIRGQVQLDSSWDNTVYLSLIPDLEDMYRCSESLIIAKSGIESDGTFELHGSVFPEQPYLVRIHVSKHGDPPATLIIGSRDENHCFLALNKNAQLNLKPAKTGLFDHFSVQQDAQNKALFHIDSLQHYFADIDTAFSSIDYKRMVQEEQTQTLLAYADTCRFVLPALYAVYLADWGANRQEIRLARERLAGRFPAHPYLQDIYGRIEDGRSPLSLWVGVVILAILIGGLLLMIRKRPPPGLRDLSVQERKILAYLYEGRSNKEIAGQLHIEPSTVKSHVYNIYQKLSISSRKEVARFGRWIGE